ncbi:MAG: efflux RND transporter periplasmic adaptor subunit [Clostridiales bacterium]|nr:efflux RND transporter periplasmic adaptor subunit [Clostridiales bacterium]
MKKKIIVGLVITVAVAGFVTLAVLKSRDSAGGFGGTAYTVKTETVSKAQISSYISASGIVEDTEKMDVFFDSSLKVRDIIVKEGGKVAKGQKVLDLDTDSMVAELDKLKATKAIQALSLESSKSDAGIVSAKSAVDSAKRAYDDSLETWNENKDKYLTGIISKDQIDLSEEAVKTAETAYNNAVNSYKAALDTRRISRETAEENLKITDISINQLEKQLEKIGENVLSPMDGIIAAMNVEKGAYLTAMQPAFRVTNPSRLQIKASVKEYDSKSVRTGQKVRITGDAIDKEAEVYGTVDYIAPSAKSNVTSGGTETVVEVTVSVDNLVDSLKPGLNATCDIYTQDKTGVIVIPMEAITYDKDGNKKVFIVDTKTNTMVEKAIKTGINSDMSVEVTEGLSEGDLLITETKPVYKDGVRVRTAKEETK